MADVALGTVASLVSTKVAATATAGAAATKGAAKDGAKADPFAALLASVAPANDGDTATTTNASEAAAVAAQLAMPVKTDATATAATTAATTSPDDLLALAEKDGDGKEPDDGDGDGETDPSTNPQLAMLLAMVGQAAPAPTPVSIPVTGATKSDAVAAPRTLKIAQAPAQIAPKTDDAKPAETTDVGDAPQSADAFRSTDSAQPAPAATDSKAAIFARLLGGTATPVALRAVQAAVMPDQTATPVTTDTTAASACATAADRAVAAQADAKLAAPAQHGAVRVEAAAGKAVHATTSAATATIQRPTRLKAATLDGAIDGLTGTTATGSHRATAAADVAMATAPSTADGIAAKTLSMASDNQWLDTLARDIAATGGKDGSLSFRLDPQNLGTLTVHITHSAEGASIRMSANTEAARSMLADAQPRLAAEAKAQGLTLRDSSVDLGGSGTGQGQHQGNASTFASLAQGQSERDSARGQSFINLNAVEGDEQTAPVAATDRSDLYA